MRRADILIEASNNEAMLYHPESDELHVLNPTAQLIWDLCDGEHSLPEIAEAVRAQFMVVADVDIQADVEQTVADFQSKNLVLM